MYQRCATVHTQPTLCISRTVEEEDESRASSSVAATDDELVPPARYRSGSVGSSSAHSASGDGGGTSGSEGRENSFARSSMSLLNGTEPSDVNVALLKAGMSGSRVRHGRGSAYSFMFRMP